MPLCYLYVSMNVSSLIHGSYPRVFRQCFLINRFDPIDLLSAVTIFFFFFFFFCQWDLHYKPWKSTLNGLRYSKPCAPTTDAFAAWFERFVNQWCLLNVQKMHFAHWLIICAKFRPLNCISKLRFQILTPPGIKFICWLWISRFCRDIHFQRTWYLSAVRHEISVQRKLILNVHVTFLFLFSILRLHTRFWHNRRLYRFVSPEVKKACLSLQAR